MNDAFDRRPMAIKTLAAAERGATRSTGHFLSFIGNTTPEVLREASGLAAGGFLNRFLFVWVERRDGVLIPRPEQVELTDLPDETARVVQHWRKRGEVVLEWTPAAEHYWDELYPSLTQPWPGIYGQMRVRGRVFVARLALVYAISDRSEVIDVEHVEAAHALWEYHVQSVERVFGTVTGNVHSDRIVAYLQEHGQATKAELNKEACGNHPEACDRGLAPLFEYGLIEVEEVAPQGERKGGRKRQVYRLA